MFDMVIVLYKMTVNESPTVRSLTKLLSSTVFPELRQVFIVDNSPNEQDSRKLVAPFSYHWNGGNVGLAKAYNAIWPQSQQAGCQWLVTLDQDTELTAEYLQNLIRTQATATAEVAIIAPIIYDQQQQISPVFTTSLRPLHNELPQSGSYTDAIMVINSGSAVALDFLADSGGYNESFPLDYLDHWLSWQVFQQKRQIQIMTVGIDHELSVLTPKALSHERYQKILAAETHFYQSYQTKQLAAFKRQLLLRAIKQLVQRRGKDAWSTLKQWRTVGGINGKQKKLT